MKTDDKKEERLAVMNFLLCRIEGLKIDGVKAESNIIIKHKGNEHV